MARGSSRTLVRSSPTLSRTGGEIASSVAIGAPGANKAIRVLGFVLIGPEMVAATGDLAIVGGPTVIHTGAMSGGNRTSGPWVPVNVLCREDTEVDGQMTDGANNDAYALTIVYRVEDVIPT